MAAVPEQGGRGSGATGALPAGGKPASPWTGQKSRCYNLDVLAVGLYLFLSGFSLFLLGLSIFMYYEGRKFGDNQFMVKLLPPPPKAVQEAVIEAPERKSDWISVGAPARSRMTGRALVSKDSRVPDFAGEAASSAV